jgi:hypothetical protein
MARGVGMAELEHNQFLVCMVAECMVHWVNLVAGYMAHWVGMAAEYMVLGNRTTADIGEDMAYGGHMEPPKKGCMAAAASGNNRIRNALAHSHHTN